MEYNLEKREIISDKILNNLDKLALSFTKILEKHMNYVIISGYVSILLGRTRITEDIDVFIEKVSFERFFRFYKELQENGFWCINAEKPEDVFAYLKDGLAVRFARKNSAVPNFEVKFAKRPIDEGNFQEFLTVKLKEGNLRISTLERHVAFKRYYLGTDKDIEDAQHIEKTFKGMIDYSKVEEYKQTIEQIKKDERRNDKHK